MEPLVEKRNYKKILLWLFVIIIFSVIVAFTTLGIFILNEKTIYNNIYVESVDVGHLSKEQARLKLEGIFDKELQRHQLKLRHQEITWDFSYEELGFGYLYTEAIEEAYSIGRKGNFYTRFVEIYRLKKNPVLITLDTAYDPELLEGMIDTINTDIYRETVNAKIEKVGNGFVITPEVNGVEMDVHELRRLMKEAVESYEKETIVVPIQYVVPKITAENLGEIRDVLGEYSTEFNSEVTGRSANILIASNSINNTILMPGETFSFNNQTGPRGVKEGYQEAPVILNGKLVPGVGGGICQVSTTLYNAVAKADLEVTKRQNHSIPVSYVPLGQDATVAYGYIDFQFINNTQHPLLVNSKVYGNRISVTIYGKKMQGYTVKLYSEVTETIQPKIEIKKDPTMYVGEQKIEKEAKVGYRVDTYKIYLKDNKEISRELISKDVYSPTNGLIYEGTKPRSQGQQNITKPEEEGEHEYIPTDGDEDEEAGL